MKTHQIKINRSKSKKLMQSEQTKPNQTKPNQIKPKRETKQSKAKQNKTKQNEKICMIFLKQLPIHSALNEWIRQQTNQDLPIVNYS